MGGSVLKLTRIILDFFVLVGQVISQVLVGLMAAVIVVGVVARYVFRSPLAFPDEYTGYLMLGITLVGANWVLKDKGHVSVDIAVSLLSPRVRKWLQVITDIITTLLVAFILIQVTKVAVQSLEAGTLSLNVTRTPVGVIQLFMPVGFGLLLIEFLRTTTLSIKSAIFLSEPENHQREASE